MNFMCITGEKMAANAIQTIYLSTFYLYKTRKTAKLFAIFSRICSVI